MIGAGKPIAQRIVLQGLEERFAGSVADALRAEGAVVRAGSGAGEGELLIAGNSVYDVDGQLAAQDAALGSGARLLRVAWAADHLWIGPFAERERSACVRCFHLWTMNPWASAIAKAASDHSMPSAWPQSFKGSAAEAVATEALSVSAPAGPGRRSTARFLSSDFRDWSRNHFFRHPECDRCPPLPDDSAQAALVAVRSDHVLRSGSLRALDLEALERIAEPAVDRRCGLVRSVRHQNNSTLIPMAFATLYPLARPTEVEIGVGRTGSRRTDSAVAVLEAIERFAGLRPRARRTRVNGRFSDLGGDAVDPRDFILHQPDQYQEPGFRFAPYSPDTPYNWVWAYSFARAAPVLVPEQLAYYALGAENMRSSPRFVYETSNGCALGGSVAEAVLHALFEVIERDAFLANWYARRPVPRVDTSAVDDPLIRSLLARLRADGMQAEVLDIRAGLPTPAFAVSVTGEGGEDRPALALAAGAHLDPVRALQGALVEVAAAFGKRDPAKAAIRPDRGRELLAHPERVLTMADHSDQCWPVEAVGQRDFLRSGTPDLDWKQGFGTDGEGPVSVADELGRLVDMVLEVASDVLVVDQSFDPFRASGLRCVKVLAPGLLPMTFGNAYRRISEERLRLIVPGTPIDLKALASLPHPFP